MRRPGKERVSSSSNANTQKTRGIQHVIRSQKECRLTCRDSALLQLPGKGKGVAFSEDLPSEHKQSESRSKSKAGSERGWFLFTPSVCFLRNERKSPDRRGRIHCEAR